MREPSHTCSHPAPPSLSAQLDGLHKTQAGARRHRCAACAYAAGYRDGTKAAAADHRVSSWLLDGAAEMCEEGRSAPRAILAGLDENQGDHRHSCAVCAWTMGWRAGIAAAR